MTTFAALPVVVAGESPDPDREVLAWDVGGVPVVSALDVLAESVVGGLVQPADTSAPITMIPVSCRLLRTVINHQLPHLCPPTITEVTTRCATFAARCRPPDRAIPMPSGLCSPSLRGTLQG